MGIFATIALDKTISRYCTFKGCINSGKISSKKKQTIENLQKSLQNVLVLINDILSIKLVRASGALLRGLKGPYHQIGFAQIW